MGNTGYWYYCKIRRSPAKEGTNGEFPLPPGNLLIGPVEQFLLRFGGSAPSEKLFFEAEQVR